MSKLVSIKTYPDRLGAEFARNLLESNGIKAVVSADDEGGQNPFLLRATGGARLMIQEEDGEAALRLLEDETGA